MRRAQRTGTLECEKRMNLQPATPYGPAHSVSARSVQCRTYTMLCAHRARVVGGASRLRLSGHAGEKGMESTARGTEPTMRDRCKFRARKKRRWVAASGKKGRVYFSTRLLKTETTSACSCLERPRKRFVNAPDLNRGGYTAQAGNGASVLAARTTDESITYNPVLVSDAKWKFLDDIPLDYSLDEGGLAVREVDNGMSLALSPLEYEHVPAPRLCQPRYQAINESVDRVDIWTPSLLLRGFVKWEALHKQSIVVSVGRRCGSVPTTIEPHIEFKILDVVSAGKSARDGDANPEAAPYKGLISHPGKPFFDQEQLNQAETLIGSLTELGEARPAAVDGSVTHLIYEMDKDGPTRALVFGTVETSNDPMRFPGLPVCGVKMLKCLRALCLTRSPLILSLHPHGPLKKAASSSTIFPWLRCVVRVEGTRL
ncbi:hypothetical protein C8R47DRAFT_1071404 [Mycena vitilis]|nr:hypothetical protein C8R47DRAFT_1071404 [Mycena vitilis]